MLFRFKTDETIRLMTRAIANTYAGNRSFVSQKDFKNKFNRLQNQIEKKCMGTIFTEDN